jgi:hypothetical protein
MSQAGTNLKRGQLKVEGSKGGQGGGVGQV